MRRVLILAAVALLAAPVAARAAVQPVFGMRGVPNPKVGYFVYTLPKGAAKTGTVLVTNNGKAAGTVSIYPADGTTGQTTGTVYLTDKKPVRAGSWIRIDKKALTLKPGQHQLVHFTVHVPARAPAGQWVAGLVAESMHVEKGKRTKRKASVQVNIRSQTILAVQVDVPGPTKAKFAIGKVTAGGARGFQQVLVGVTNTGNAMAKPTGALTISDASGKKLETIPFKMDTFLPKTTIDYPVVLKTALPPGDYQAAVNLDYGTGTATAQPSFTVSKQNVQQVFTSTSPTQAAPGVTTGGGKTSSSNTLLLALVVIGGLILVALIVLIFIRRKPG